jgi:phage protein D
MIMGLTPRDGIIKSIYLEETCGFELPVCKLVIGNIRKGLSSTILAKEQSSFRVQIGWRNPGLQDHGVYIVQRPKFRFASGTRDTDIEIVAYGEAVKLGATERRQVYKKMRDSDIAEMIAARNGFEADVDRTSLVHDQVIQANESDYKFLAKRAKLHGFLLSVENGVMRFQRPRPCDSGIRLTCLEPNSINNFIDFSVRSRTFMRAARLNISQIDPVTKEEFTVDDTDAVDPLQRGLGLTNWEDLVSIDGVGRPQRFITNEGHEQRRSLWLDQISRMAESQRYVISGMGSALGMETLRPKDLITMAGVGRSDGKYFVTRTMHSISAGGNGGYRTRFEVVRAGAGELNNEAGVGGLVPQEVELESEGTVAL